MSDGMAASKMAGGSAASTINGIGKGVAGGGKALSALKKARDTKKLYQ